MKAEYSRRYSSTRFVALTDSESVANARKKYFFWIAVVTTLFCITGTYLYYKIFIEPISSSNESSPPFSKGPSGAKKNWKLYNPKPLLDEFRRNHYRDLPCDESQTQLQAIPEIFVQLFEKDFENINNFIYLDLLLHYEKIIHKNGASTLKDIFNEYQLTLSGIENPRDFIKFLKVLKSNKFKFYAQYLKEQDLDLKTFESVFALTEELNYWYNYLNQLNVFLSSYEQQKERNYFVNCTIHNFVNFTENTQRRLWHFAYSFKRTDKKMQEINEIINHWAQTVTAEYYNYSVVFYNKILLLSDVNRELRGLNISSLKSASFFASHTIFLDEDVVLPGVDLTIIAPNWRFLKKIKVDLNGPDGKNATSGADPPKPGEPGQPGGNGGDFVGVGDLHEKFLLVSANGGRGGSGQNGARGQDGVNHTFPGPPVNKPECATKVKAFKNLFGQLITHYKIYNASGCGQPGTDGGVGGLGGTGGTIALITKRSMRTTTGSNGTAGSQGKGGPGGTGGRDGCFYEVLDVDDETLHRVTRVKCLSGNILPRGGFGRDNHNTWGQVFPSEKKNLKIHQCLAQFIRYTKNDANAAVISLLQHVIQLVVNNAADIKDLIPEYKFLETFDKPELYAIFNKQIHKLMQNTNAEPVLAYLKSITLGQITISKANMNYYFVDIKNFLNLLKKSIKNTNKDTRDFKPSLYLKQKIKVKRDVIKENLKRIRFALSSSPQLEDSRENSCKILATVEVLQILSNETLEAKSSDLFSSCTTDSAGRRKIFPKEKQNLFRTLQSLRNKENVGGHLVQLKDALCAARESEEFSDEEKNLIQVLTDQLEHFTALYYFVEWEESENLFLKSLYELNKSSQRSEEEEFLKNQLLDVMITLQYSLALDATRQNSCPLNIINNRPRLFQNESTIDYVLSQINLLEENVNKKASLFCGNHLTAVFDEKSAVGEFYFWPNAEIRPKLLILFSGKEVAIKSDLINRHIFDKNFLQFTSLKLEFECNKHQNDCQKQLTEILANFKIQIIHSGYSYYNLNEETRIVVSERVNFEYSFRMRDNKEPEIYNGLYAKCQNGEIKLSPFTIWTIRLLPINEGADFKELLSFVDVVNLRLVGSGTYTP